MPRRTPSDLADIVVFHDDAKKNPYIVVECKKDKISEAEFSQAIEQAFGNCHSRFKTKSSQKPDNASRRRKNSDKKRMPLWRRRKGKLSG